MTQITNKRQPRINADDADTSTAKKMPRTTRTNADNFQQIRAKLAADDADERGLLGVGDKWRRRGADEVGG